MKTKNELKTKNRAWIPNLVTSLRIFGGISLIFLPVLGISFYIVYILCGLSDVLDGFLARKLRTASAFGARLDSIADLTFYAVLLLRLLPKLRLRLPKWIWYVVGVILCLRLSAYLVAAFRQKEFSSKHTCWNKASGAAVFGIGLMLEQSCLTPYCIGVCAVALIASGNELKQNLLTPAK